MKNTKIIGLGLLALASGLVLGTAHASTLSFVSQVETLTKDCPTTVDVMIDTEGQEINSLDFVLLENDSFVLNQIKTDEGVFRTYTNPKDSVANEGKYAGRNTVRLIATTASQNGFNGDGKLLSLVITPKSDNVKLELYDIAGYEGDDTNLVMVTEDNEAVDTLKAVDPAEYNAVEGECALAPMEKISLEKPATTVSAEEVTNIIEDTTQVNEENVFDASQEKNFLQENWLYIAAGLAIIIIVLIVALKPKKEVNKKK
jgi:hypothetical protein